MVRVLSPCSFVALRHGAVQCGQPSDARDAMRCVRRSFVILSGHGLSAALEARMHTTIERVFVGTAPEEKEKYSAQRKGSVNQGYALGRPTQSLAPGFSLRVGFDRFAMGQTRWLAGGVARCAPSRLSGRRV